MSPIASVSIVWRIIKIVFKCFIVIRASQERCRNHNLTILLSSDHHHRISLRFHLFLVGLMQPDGLWWRDSSARQRWEDLDRRSQLHSERRSWGRHSVLFCIAGYPATGGQVQPRLLLGFEEGVGGEVVGDDVGESCTSVHTLLSHGD